MHTSHTMPAPPDRVTSVNGYIGAVTLESTDVGAAAAPTTWTAVTPGSNVAHSATHDAQARLINSGTSVELRGRLAATGNISPQIVGTLPASHRPAYELKLAVPYTGGSGVLTVATNGQITSGMSLTAGQEIYLDGIMFAIGA